MIWNWQRTPAQNTAAGRGVDFWCGFFWCGFLVFNALASNPSASNFAEFQLLEFPASRRDNHRVQNLLPKTLPADRTLSSVVLPIVQPQIRMFLHKLYPLYERKLKQTLK
jgi:hypothetical protein